MKVGRMGNARATVNMDEKLELENYTRFSVWDKNKPLGEYIVRIYEYIDEVDYSIETLIKHSENGIDLDYEETRTIQDGFCKDNTEKILKILESGEDGYVKGHYIKILTPSFPLPKSWNPKYIECHEKWLKEDEFKKEVLDVIGKATFEQAMEAFNAGKWIAWRYINQEFYTDSVTKSAGRCDYIQLFADGENIGWCEDHPHREYKKTEDGRNIAVGEPTIYYDLLLATDKNGKWLVKSGRTGRSLFCWIKREK